MNILELIANLLEQANFGQLGKDIFFGGLLPNPGNCIAVAPGYGYKPLRIHSDQDAIHVSGIEIIVRNEKFDQGYCIARMIIDLFLKNSSLPGVIDIILPQSEPLYTFIDENNRHRFSIHLIVRW